MLRFLGNTTVAMAKKQVCRKGMLPLQYRNCSSMSGKAVPKIYGYFFKTAFGGAGFLLGGVTTSPYPRGLQEIEEEIKQISIDDDSREVWEKYIKTCQPELSSSLKENK